MKINLTPSRIGRLRPRKNEFTMWDSTTPHFGIRVAPTGAMRFIHMAKVDGKLRKTTIGDATRMPLDQARAAARDIDAGAVEEVKPCPTFREWVEGVWRPQASPRLKPSTRKSYGHALAAQLLPAFGRKRLDAINRDAVLRWFDPYSRRAPGGSNEALSVLGSILGHAARTGVVPSNPVRGIRRNPERRVTRFLGRDERERLLAAIDALPPEHMAKGLAIKMLLFTGCRANEIAALRWSEVGEKALDLADSKTGARRVWLGTEARAILDRARALHNESGGSDYVFPDPMDGSRCVRGFDVFWRRLRGRVGLSDVRLHDLRHSFATEAVRQGIPLAVVSKLLGHANIEMTMRYAHASNKEAEEAAELVAGRLAVLLAGDG